MPAKHKYYWHNALFMAWSLVTAATDKWPGTCEDALRTPAGVGKYLQGLGGKWGGDGTRQARIPLAES